MPYSSLSKLYESGASFRGAMLVQELSEGLFNKNKFRAYLEFAAAVCVRMQFDVPFMLTSQRLWTGQGAARGVVSTGGTQSGTFTTLPTKFCLNTLGGDVPGRSVFTVGGSVAGGTEREVLRSDSGTSGGGSGNADLLSSNRILNPGVYYFTITPTGITSGIWSIEWEELPELA